MNSLVKRISEKLTDIVNLDPNILLVYHNGSFVVGTNTDSSDIDFVIVVESKDDVDVVLEELKGNLNFIGVNHEVPNFEFEGKTVAICIYDNEAMDFFTNVLFRSKEDFLQWQKFVQHKIIETEPLFDPHNLLDLYRSRVFDDKNIIWDEVFSDSISELEKILSEWKNTGFRNEFNFISHLPDILEKICTAIYSKNKKFFMVHYKRLPRDLDTLKPEIKTEMYFLIKGDNGPENLDQKRLMTERIVDKLKVG